MSTGKPVGEYLPALDGVRAVAIALVLFSHSTIYLPETEAVRPVGLEAGYAGVTVFFVLSGYLITRLLVREEDRTGRVSLRAFYARRAVRLFPALWLYLLVVFILWQLGRVPDHPWHSFVTALFYVRNLVGRGHETAHLWSLSIEEQFYLVWPLAFLLAGGSHRLRLVGAVVGVVAALGWRWFAVEHGLATDGALHARTDYQASGLLMGCAAALVERVAPAPSWFAVPAGRILVGLVAAAAGAGAIAWYAAAGRSDVAGEAPVAACTVGLLASVVAGPNWWTRALSARPLVALGRVSYGVYLWQQLFLGPVALPFEEVRREPAAGLALTFAAALLSYYLLERPLLRWKDRTFGRGRPAAPTPEPR